MIRFLRSIDLIASSLAQGQHVAASFAASTVAATFAASTEATGKAASSRLGANLASAACVAAAILLPGSVAISEPALLPAGDGISGPPRNYAARLIDHRPLGKSDRLQPAPVIAEDDAPPAQEAAPAAKDDAPTTEGAAASKDCDPDDAIAYWFEHGTEPACAHTAQNDSLEADRAYLVESASPGYTMERQGPELAIGRLNPEFVRRLAAAIRDARAAGLPSVGIFSAYRPPAFGVGGFSNKFNSLHSYGLAVDMTGIGGPGSGEAKSWHEIAARHGVVCPYGPNNHSEWNHCQPTAVKIIMAANPLRETITAEGPTNLDSMFQAGKALIEASAGEEPGAEGGQGGKGFHLAGSSSHAILHLASLNHDHGGHAKARTGHGAAHADAAAKVQAEHHRFKRLPQNEKA
jgi:hypothetical protein